MNWLRRKIFDFGLRFILEKLPFVKDFDGSKRLIGKIALAVGVVVDAVSGIIHYMALNFGAELPSLLAVDTKAGVIAGTVTAGIGAVIKLLGDLHAADKADRG